MIKLVSYNIHQCIGRDGHYSPERITAVLKRLDADIIILQEVEVEPEPRQNILATMGEDLQMETLYGITMQRAENDYGNAILTRLPVKSVYEHNLSVSHHEPRGALEVWLDMNGHNVQLVGTHLGMRPGERRDQVRRLLPLFEVSRADIRLLAGDLNEWFLWGRPLRWLHKIFPDTPSLRTFPAHWPLFDLDRIWVQPRKFLKRLYTERNELTRVASDHLPLVAQLDLGPSEQTE